MTDLITETPVFFGQADEFFGIFTTGAKAGRLGAVICVTPSMADKPRRPPTRPGARCFWDPRIEVRPRRAR